MGDVVKYRFAQDNQNIPVDVESLDRQTGVSGSFYCYGCGHELIAHLGLKRARHFQHKANESNCARETYLHALAKSVFVDAFKEHQAAGTPYYLEQRVEGTCTHYEQDLHFTCPREEIQRHDLTKWFDVCNAETGYKGFVADVLLASTTRQEVLMIEFSVTHDCEPEKIASGARIVEIPIRDENDVAALRDGLLQDGKHPGFRSYNLKNRPTRGPMCGGECPNEVGLFIVYKNGKSFLKDIPAKTAIKPQLRGQVAHYEIVPPGVRWDTGSSLVQVTEIPKKYDDADPSMPATVFERRSVEAHFNGIPIRSCYVCRFHGADGINAAVFCRKHREPCSANAAADCADYAPVRTRNEYESLKSRNARWAKEHGVAAAFRSLLRRSFL